MPCVDKMGGAKNNQTTDHFVDLQMEIRLCHRHVGTAPMHRHPCGAIAQRDMDSGQTQINFHFTLLSILHNTTLTVGKPKLIVDNGRDNPSSPATIGEHMIS